METTNRIIKTGSYTLALGLITLGVASLVANLGFLEVSKVLKLWPLLMIGLGLEYFIQKLTTKGEEVQFSIPSTVLIGLITVSIAIASALYSFLTGGMVEGELKDILRSKSIHSQQWQQDPATPANPMEN